MAKKEEATEKKVILSQQEQEIRSLIDRAGDGPPRITDINELFTRLEMQIPEAVRRPECVYRWLSTDNLHKEVLGNERWALVTRSNHSKAPSHLFGDSGGIMYGGDAILCFQWRDQAEAVQHQIEKEFNFNAEKTINPDPKKIRGPGGNEMAIIERVEAKSMGAATLEAEMPAGNYDFGDT